MRIAKPAAWCLCAALPLAAHTLRIAPAAASPGSGADAVIVLEEDSAAPVIALQWTLSVPLGSGIESARPVLSPFAAEAGKSLTCAGRPKPGGKTYQWTCVLAGGRRKIPAGALASAAFRIAPGARPGSHPLAFEGVKGVDGAARAVPVRASAGRLTVR